MTRRRTLAGLLRERRGATAALVALAFTVLAGATALVTDVGMLEWQKRRLQAAVDAAALAAARVPIGERRTPEAIGALARTVLTDNGFPGARLTAPPRIGRYAEDRADRILELPGTTPTATPAVEIRADADVGLSLMRLFVSEDRTRVASRAVAAQRPLGGFTLGSGLAAVDTVQAEALNPLLGQWLRGTSLSLNAVDYNALLTSDVRLFPFLDALASSLNVTAGDYDALLRQSVNVGTLLGLAATALAPGGASGGAANALASAAIGNNRTLLLGDLLTLGPQGLNPGHPLGDDASYATLGLNAYELLWTAAALGGRNQVVGLGNGLSVAGAQVGASLTVIEPPVLAVGPVGTQAHTSQLRLALDLQLLNLNGNTALTGLLGLTLNLLGVRIEGSTFPITVDVAAATGELRSVGCAGASPGTGTDMTVRATTTVATVRLGSSATPATLLRLTLLGQEIASITAYASVNVGGATVTDVNFSANDVLNGNIKAAPSNPGAVNILGELIEDLHTEIHTGPGRLDLGALVTPVLNSLVTPLRNILGLTLGALDPVLATLLDRLGIDIGYAHVRSLSARCGVVALVR